MIGNEKIDNLVDNLTDAINRAVVIMSHLQDELKKGITLSPSDVKILQAAYPNITGASPEYLEQFRKILGIVIEEPEPKTVIIEKWLVGSGDPDAFCVWEGSVKYLKYCVGVNNTHKIKVLDSYEVELP